MGVSGKSRWARRYGHSSPQSIPASTSNIARLADISSTGSLLSCDGQTAWCWAQLDQPGAVLGWLCEGHRSLAGLSAAAL